MDTHILENVRQKNPLVQALTNYVTVNDCANILLACGASPIMADNPEESAEIAAMSAAVAVNIGTPNPKAVEGMVIAGEAANRRGIPVVLDPVGAGASQFRNDILARLIGQVRFTVIRGNISEIRFLAGLGGKAKGVDASSSDTLNAGSMEKVAEFARDLSDKTGAVIVITGETDVIAGKTGTYLVRNGHPLMAKITGSGCMLTTLTAAFCGANPDMPTEAAAAATAAMGLCGELAHEKMKQLGGGTGTFRTLLIDFMSSLDGPTLAGGAKIEKIS